MGTNSIPTATSGNIIPKEHHNAIKEALSDDLVPRNTAGSPTDEAGDLGSSSYSWKRIHASVGYLFPGIMMPFYDYNGTLAAPHGWMICDGRIINETNYNTEHGAGTWDTYIVSSLLDGKYLPNMHSSSERYLAGESSKTTQAGTSAITTVGNSGNTINIAHTHTSYHQHQWYQENGTNAHDTTFDNLGIAKSLNGSNKTLSRNYIPVRADTTYPNPGTSYTDIDFTISSSGLSAAQNIRPESFRVLWYMRII